MGQQASSSETIEQKRKREELQAKMKPILEDKNVYPTEPAIESVMPVWPISKNPVPPELAARMPERQETIRIVNEMKRTVWGDYAKNNDDVKWTYHPVAAYCPNCEERVVTVVDHKWGNYSTNMLILSFFSFFCCLCFFPLCVNSFKDVQHFCPNKADGCGFLLGTYER